ncbi:putative bifunctional diguanylate cyclase/phosphodiesterase [Plasticicumulans acidivorans]|uniref:cyclic-guanylate-specific phosphodiesterase n=1 Tax=Plasticicumulans acidivorans TaxID=886464 RepID=A0A317MS03_9GAMM|nr:EAL domain-containing protein [Plasticicumulans acidivorans]PWV58725.1 diguanylate cyclase (GGDEF)-like protein [Plasticicumulans acidivorans]
MPLNPPRQCPARGPLPPPLLPLLCFCLSLLLMIWATVGTLIHGNSIARGQPQIAALDIALLFVGALCSVLIALAGWVLRKQQTETWLRAEHEAQLAHLAGHDALTGLPNRLLLRDRLGHDISHAQRESRQLAVMFIDLDRFKTINDSLGHAVGDELLRVAARRLRATLRSCDTLARIGGDEFVVVVEDVDGPEAAALVTRKLLDALLQPMPVLGREFVLTASIGISLYPHDGLDVDQLLMAADTAMYTVKASGRDGYRFYEPSMHARALTQLERERDLRRALELGEFELHYQPQVDLGSGRLSGLEALLRWRHPQRGLVPPDSFIPLAEETGLIVPIGAWVICHACTQLAAWRAAGLAPPRVAVNLSARQFVRPQLVSEILDAVGRAGLDVSMLELEITESALMHDVESAIRQMNELHDAGLRLAIDDFGTGYSSLAYLQRFPVGLLKIDRTFIADMTTNHANAAIARTVVQLAQNLGLQVLAEGVEERAQVQMLRALGCHFAQGWLFARALEPAAVEQLLRAERSGKRLLTPATAALGSSAEHPILISGLCA